MSWLSDIANSVGGVFGYGDIGDQISDFLPDVFSSDGPVGIGPVANPDTYASMLKPGYKAPDSIWDSSDIWKGILGAGTSLAGTYYGMSSQKDMAEQYAQQQALANEQAMALAREEMANKLKIAQIGAGAAGAGAAAARKNTLANLYSNWAQLTQRGGEAGAQSAIEAGKGITAGINARASVLR